MAGRHRDTTENLAPRRFPGVVPAIGVALALVAGVGGWALVTSGGGCGARIPLDVVAAPDIAPVVRGIAARVTEAKPKIDGQCIEVRVSAQPSASMAAVLSGAEVGTGPLPEVWIPDSSLWVDQIRALSSQSAVLPDQASSIASSPTVIAAPVPVARQMGASGGVGWGTLLQQLNGEQALKIGFPNPQRNTTGLTALLSVAQATGDSPQARAQQAAVARKLSEGAAEDVRELFAQLPKTPDPTAIASSLAALPVTEQSVWRYNADKPAVPLVALYPQEGAVRLDYPYVALQDAPDPKRLKAAERFLAELRSESSRRDLSSNGFRSPDGQAGGALTAAAGVNPRPPKAADPPAPQAIAGVLKSWQALSLKGRMLVLLDVSGSMTAKIPGVNKSRLETVVGAAQQGLGLLSDATEVGVWVFASELDGKKDYKQIIPPGPLARPIGDVLRREAVTNALTRVQAIPNGSTGLYDSIDAVHRVAVAGYQPDKINSVLVYTDGKNSDPTGGISLDGLLAELRKRSDPERPIPIFILGFGPDADMASARKIAAVTSGEAYHVNSVGEITAFFLDAIGRRTCRPRC